MTDGQQAFDFDAGDPLELQDAEARVLATDPTKNVALEASAGTGKTRVLVDRYIALLLAGVKPVNVLAITFTRKAAAEMRQRILQELARRQRERLIPEELWRELRENLTEISISTIDAFCLSLLREFPLEADVDPGFDLADETETPRLVAEAIERTLRIGRAIAADEHEMALLFAELGEFRLREGLARLLDRRLVAWEAIGRFLRGAGQATIDQAVASLLGRLRAAFASVPGGVNGLVASGPDHADFRLFVRDLRQLLSDPAPSAPLTQALLERVRTHVLTQDGEPRKRLTYKRAEFRSGRDYQHHAAAVAALGPYVAEALRHYRADINRVLARAVRKLFAVALDEYQRTLRKHGVLDFADVLQRTLGLLSQMDEFSRSRFKLEARYQHVLVDEFQDTSRAQWTLVELLVRSWAAGMGSGDQALTPSIFIVGDRKQSIYGFRDAEVAVLDEASRYIAALRPQRQVRTAITRSFRAVRELLAFVNDVGDGIEKTADRADRFRYDDRDRFPLGSVAEHEADALALIAARSDQEQAEIAAEEIARVLASGATVRDRTSGVRRAARPGDIAVLFRTREGHRLFEDALARRRVPYYVYKGLGFFDADEIKDTLALVAFLARPQSELNAAAFLRSRFVRLSDEALKLLAPALSQSLTSADEPAALHALHPADRARLVLARAAVPRWLALVDRLPPSELLDRVLAESAYAAELAGPSYQQARENLKKVRTLVRRIQNRGYATLARIVDHFAELVAGGDESNAIVDAVDAVNLMTAHAAKGLEFPIVFVVNLNKGSGGSPDPIRVFARAAEDDGSGGAWVAIGDYESEGDRDLELRETEEAKRLLYVAMTRARDRLYLAATVSENPAFVTGKGGLGRMLPPTLGRLIATAEAGVATWAGASTTHRLRVIRSLASLTVLGDLELRSSTRVDDFEPLPADGPVRVAATSLLQSVKCGATDSAATSSALEAGVLVHRAIDAGLLVETVNDLETRMLGLVKPHEQPLVDDLPSLVRRSVSAMQALRKNPDVVELFGEGASDILWRRHEVPFTLRRADGVLVRGTIDCVVKHASGVVEVIEFKTGRPLAIHDAQLGIYADAARALFPESRVQARLIYATPAAGQLS